MLIFKLEAPFKIMLWNYIWQNTNPITRGKDLKSYLPISRIWFSSVLGHLILLIRRLQTFYLFENKTNKRHLCEGLGSGLMLMHSMTSENKYALAGQGETESIDPYLFIITKLAIYTCAYAIILSREGHRVLSIEKHVVRPICTIPRKIRLISKECFVVCMPCSTSKKMLKTQHNWIANAAKRCNLRVEWGKIHTLRENGSIALSFKY